jgi:hypothetical protein
LLLPLRLLARRRELSAAHLKAGLVVRNVALFPQQQPTEAQTPPVGAVLQVQAEGLSGPWFWSIRYLDMAPFLESEEDADVLLAALRCVAAQPPRSAGDSEVDEWGDPSPSRIGRLVARLCFHSDDRVRREAQQWRGFA